MGEGTEEARRAREMVCWARVMVGKWVRYMREIGVGGNYMALVSRLTAIAIVCRFGLSRARAVGKVVFLSFRKLYGVAERPSRQSSES